MRYLRSRLASPVSRCCTVRNCRTPSAPTVRLYNPSTYTSRSQTDADRRSHELLRAASFVVHNRILVAAFLGATFLVADAPPLLVAAASRHRRFSSPPLLVDVVGRRSFVAIAAAVAASPSPASRATPTAQRRGEGSARQRCILGFRSATSLVCGRQNQRYWAGCQLVLAPGFIFWNAVSSPPRSFR